MSENNNNGKVKRFSWLTIIQFVVIVFSIIGAIIALDGFIDKKIENKIKNPEYINSLSNTLRSFLIFNHNENIIYDHGAKQLIDSISVSKIYENNIFKKPLVIIIYPKYFLKTEPLIECLNSIYYTKNVVRYKNIAWKYSLFINGYTDDLKDIRFRLEILN